MTIRTRMAVATLTVACFASLIGCGTPRVEPGSTPSAAALVLPTPAASDFVSTVMRTRVLGTAELTVDVTTTTPDGTTRLTGSGPAGISQGYGGLTWVTDNGETFTEISNGKGLFVQTGGSDGMWTKLARQGVDAHRAARRPAARSRHGHVGGARGDGAARRCHGRALHGPDPSRS